MQHTGWRKQWRKIWDNPMLAGRPNHMVVWMWVLDHVVWEPKKVLFNGEVITLKPGQVTAGCPQIASYFTEGITPLTVWRVLKDMADEKKYKEETLIEIQATNKCSLITVKNWEKYQNLDIPMKDERKTDDIQMKDDRYSADIRLKTNNIDTNKIEEDKNDRTKEITAAAPQFLSNEFAKLSNSIANGKRKRGRPKGSPNKKKGGSSEKIKTLEVDDVKKPPRPISKENIPIAVWVYCTNHRFESAAEIRKFISRCSKPAIMLNDSSVEKLMTLSYYALMEGKKMGHIPTLETVTKKMMSYAMIAKEMEGKKDEIKKHVEYFESIKDYILSGQSSYIEAKKEDSINLPSIHNVPAQPVH